MSVEHCVRPGDITDEDRVAYASGERPRRVRDHVRACPACAADVGALTAAEDRLGQALFRYDCPNGLALGEYYLGLMPDGERRRVAAHLERCPHCSAELATAAGFLDETAAAAPPETPGRRARRAVRSALQRIVAEFIPPPPQAAAALRGRGSAVTWRYRGGDDLLLTVHPQPADTPRGQYQLLGFVEQRDAPLDALTGTPVRLVDEAGVTVAATTIDEIGNLMVGPAPPGRYTLELTLPDRIIVVPDLAVGVD